MPKFNWETIDPETRKKMLERMSPEDAALFAEPEPFKFSDPKELYEKILAEQRAIPPRPEVPYPDLSMVGSYLTKPKTNYWDLFRIVFFFVIVISLLLKLIKW